MKWVIRFLNWGVGAIVLFIVLSNFWILSSSRGQIFSSIEKLPQADTVIVFGTSKFKVGGGINPFFENRMKAAAEVYHAGKGKILILSGSTDKSYYNEPKKMKEALIELGVSSKNLILDTLGVRTINSILRGKEIYHTTKSIFITQKYHAHRALFLANQIEMEAVCYEARFPKDNYSAKTIIREVLARPKAILDSFIFL